MFPHDHDTASLESMYDNDNEYAKKERVKTCVIDTVPGRVRSLLPRYPHRMITPRHHTPLLSPSTTSSLVLPTHSVFTHGRR